MKQENLTIASKLGNFLTFLWGLALIGAFMGGILILVSLVKPSLLLLEHIPRPFLMKIIPQAPSFPIESSAAWMQEPSLRLFGMLDFRAGGYGMALLYLIKQAPALGLGLYIIYHLRKFFLSLASGTPFSLANALRLKKIGWAIILTNIGFALYDLIFSLFVVRGVALTGARAILEWESVVKYFLSDCAEIVFLGFAILAIGEVFRIGARMQEDQELTI